MLKAIVFDFGNVLYDLDLELFDQNLTTLLEEDVTEKYPPFLVEVVLAYHAGKISTEYFIWKIQQYKKGKLNPRSIINTWNSMLAQFPAHRWKFLEDLKQDYSLFILSNINEMHLDTAYKHISKVHGKIDFETKYFDGVFYSHLVHAIKPHKEIYSIVENTTGLKGHELLFIDDKSENIVAAQKLGWNAILHDPKNDIVEVFDEYLQRVNT